MSFLKTKLKPIVVQGVPPEWYDPEPRPRFYPSSGGKVLGTWDTSLSPKIVIQVLRDLMVALNCFLGCLGASCVAHRISSNKKEKSSFQGQWGSHTKKIPVAEQSSKFGRSRLRGVAQSHLELVISGTTASRRVSRN